MRLPRQEHKNAGYFPVAAGRYPVNLIGIGITTADSDSQFRPMVNDPAASRPLCVDLDGSLVVTDTLWESIMALTGHRPLTALALPWWLFKGRAGLKRAVAQHTRLDPATLPYHGELLDFLRARQAAGQPLVLTTAADERVARPIADHLGIFDQVIASDGQTNLKGAGKLNAIQARYGDQGFDYVGNANADIPLWRAATQSYAVASPAQAERWNRQGCRLTRVFPSHHAPGAAIQAMRPFQWCKNLLLILPLLLAHQYHHLDKIVDCAIAFLCFCLCASAVYIFNDLVDLETDRKHPTKRRRPFASGRVPIPMGIALGWVSLIGAFGLAAVVSGRFLGVLCVYGLLTTAYTLDLKKRLLVDVVTLAGLYTLRILAGGVATGIEVSAWLMGFSMFLFFSLALAKRYTELAMLQGQGKARSSRRGYVVTDLETIAQVGIASGMLSVLVFSLYISESETAVRHYPNRGFLWLMCPLLLYWVVRVWFIAKRRCLHDDPIVFALKDPVSYATAITAVVIVFLSASKGFMF